MAAGALCAVVLAGCGGGGTPAGSLPVAVVPAHALATTAHCAPGPSGVTVVASGRLARSATEPATLTLVVTDVGGGTLVRADTAHSAPLAAGARSWRVVAEVTQGYPPVDCAVDVGAAQDLVTVVDPSGSMRPTVEPGEKVITNLAAYVTGRPRPGDLVSFRRPADDTCDGASGTPVVDRVVAVAGQRVEARRGAVVVDGRPLAEPWLAAGTTTADFGPLTVPAGTLYVLGDDRAAGCDSRAWGPLPLTAVTGGVVKVVPPPPSATSPSPARTTRPVTTPATVTTGT